MNLDTNRVWSQNYPYLDKILGGEWHRLTYWISRASNSGVLDLEGAKQGLSVRAKAIVCDAFSTCANELCQSCESISLLYEGLRVELPRFLLEQFHVNQAFDLAQIPTVRAAFELAENPGLVPLHVLPPGSCEFESEPANPTDTLATGLAHEVFWLRKTAIDKLRLLPILSAKGLSFKDLTRVVSGGYRLQAAVFAFDRFAVDSFGTLNAPDFEKALEDAATQVVQRFGDTRTIRVALQNGKAAWVQKNQKRLVASTAQDQTTAGLAQRPDKLSERDRRVHDIVGELFLTLGNSEIMSDPSVTKHLRAARLKPGDAAKNCLDRIRKAKCYPLSGEIRKKRTARN